VEVDATYYTLLPTSTVENWLRWTPDDFRFVVKAHPVFTGHPVDVRKLPAPLREKCSAAGHSLRAYASELPLEIVDEIESEFLASIAPLVRHARLSAVLVQFPPWFDATRGNARKVQYVAERLRDVPIAVEFRNPSWLFPERRERVAGLLRELGATLICTDSPIFEKGGGEPFMSITNEKLAVVRFHGHNGPAWAKKGASVLERFNYLYAVDELRPWIARFRALAARVETVHAVFNNCVRNYAVLNAKDLSVLLTEAT
jgi:uncharacterized protein YecE (DUF72 family)